MFAFWNYVYQQKIYGAEILAMVVKGENGIGDITKEEYQQITGFVYPATK